MTILTISREGKKRFLVDDKSLPGSPPVGRGKNMKEAIGDWVFHNRARVNVDFALDKSAEKSEMKRRKKELAQR